MLTTREYYPGTGWVTEQADFQRYGDPSGSAAGWWSLMQSPLYKDVLNAPDLQSAIGAIGRSPYATDPAYGTKVGRMTPNTPAQQAFYEARVGDLLAAGASPTMAHLGARQSALETGWGRSAPGNNYFGIKAPTGNQNAMMLAQAGRPDIEQGLYAEIPPMGAQAPQQQAPGMAMPPPQAQQPPGFMDRLNSAMSSPLFLTGASILANNTGNYGAAAPAIGRGLMGGQAMAGAMQEDALNAQMKRMQMQAAQQKMAQEEQAAAMVEQYIQGLPPEERALARMNPDAFTKAMIAKQYGGSSTQYGLGVNYETDKEGNYYAVRYGSDGSKIVEKMDRVPAALEMRTPDYLRQQAEQRAIGGEVGKQRGQAQMGYGVALDKANQGLQVVEDLLNHPGQQAAVGFSSAFPSMPGGQAANYEAKLGQLQGKMFLEAFESLKGGGQITEVEGIKATQAISDLATSQSEPEHRKSLEVLRDIFQNAKRRAAEKAGITIQKIGD